MISPWVATPIQLSARFPAPAFPVASGGFKTTFNPSFTNPYAYPLPMGQALSAYPAQHAYGGQGSPSTFQPPHTHQLWHDHPHEHPKASPQRRLAQAAGALGLIAASLYLRKFPVKASRFELFPTDWKIWAQTILGAQAVNGLNQAADAKPAPWLNALETVAVVSPLISGPLKAKTWRQLPLLATAVPLLVQATQFLDDKLESILDNHQSSVPRWIPRIGLSIASTVLGLVGLRGVIKTPLYQRYVNQGPSALTGATVGAEATMVCSRCGGVHLICVNELADMVAGVGNWFHQRVSSHAGS